MTRKTRGTEESKISITETNCDRQRDWTNKKHESSQEKPKKQNKIAKHNIQERKEGSRKPLLWCRLFVVFKMPWPMYISSILQSCCQHLFRCKGYVSLVLTFCHLAARIRDSLGCSQVSWYSLLQIRYQFLATGPVGNGPAFRVHNSLWCGWPLLNCWMFPCWFV